MLIQPGFLMNMPAPAIVAGGGGGTSFDPLSIPGLFAFYEPRDPENVSVSGRYTNIKNKAESAWTSSNLDTRVFVGASVGAESEALFDGNGYNFGSASAAKTTGGGINIFAVMQSNDPATTNSNGTVGFGVGDHPNTVSAARISYVSSSGLCQFAIAGGFTNSVNTGLANNERAVFSLSHNVETGRTLFRVNSVSLIDRTDSLSTKNILHPRMGSNGSAIHCGVFAALAATGNKSEAEILEVETYLASEFGVSI